MRGTRTIWGAAFALGLIGLATCGSLGGCTSKQSKSKKLGERRGSRSALDPGLSQDAATLENAAAPTLAPNTLPSAIVQTLQTAHEQRLEVVPPRVPRQRLAFGPGRLLQASADHVVLRDTQRGESLARVDIGPVLAVSHAADGALIAVGASSGLRFESQSQKAVRFPHVTFLPDSLLLPDLERPTQFYVYYPSAEQQLLRYTFTADAGAFLPIESSIAVPGCTSAPIQLRDGALCCRTAVGFARKAPRGTRSDFEPAHELAEPVALAPAQRFDEVYSVARDGEVKRLRLVPGAPIVGAFQLPAPPFAVVGNGEVLAFVLVSAPEPGKERRWTLLVTDLDGRVRFQSELAGQLAGPEEEWAAAVVEAKNLAISWFEPLVAVGGAAQVSAWDYRSGELRFAR